MVDWKAYAERQRGRGAAPLPSGPVIARAPASQLVDPLGARIATQPERQADPRPTMLVPTFLGYQSLPVQRSGLGHSQLGILDREKGDAHEPTILLVKHDANHPDPYVRRLNKLPDLVAGRPAPAVNANKMSGVPEGIDLRGWRPSTRYYTGVTDLTSQGDFREHLRRRDMEALQDESND